MKPLEGAAGNYRKMLVVLETSHAGLYNDASYGNVYRTRWMSSFVRDAYLFLSRKIIKFARL